MEILFLSGHGIYYATDLILRLIEPTFRILVTPYYSHAKDAVRKISGYANPLVLSIRNAMLNIHSTSERAAQHAVNPVIAC
jgi:hypothetical protein